MRALGDVAFYYDDYPAARKYYEDAIILFQRVGDILGNANAVMSLARLKFFESRKINNVQQDLNCVFEARRKMNDLASEGEDHLGFAVALISCQMWAEASTYISKARTIFENVHEQALIDEITYIEHGVSNTQSALDLFEKDRAGAKELLLEAKLDFAHVGDFLLYKFVDDLIAACEE